MRMFGYTSGPSSRDKRMGQAGDQQAAVELINLAEAFAQDS